MATSTFRYEKLASRVERMIETGTIRPGERVPSVRKLSRESGLSISTVLQAYVRLESEGWIEARPQSGYFALGNPRRLPPEPGASVSARSAGRVDVAGLTERVIQAVRDPSLVPLGAACPSPDLFPVAALHHAQAALIRRLGANVHTYDVAPGNQELRRQIARRSLLSGCALSAEDIVVTAGCIDALHLSLRAVTRPGDIVAVESPSYFGILAMLESLKLRALPIATHPRTGVELDALESALGSTRVSACVFMPSFHNPLGACMPDEKKKDLVALLAERDIPLIEDDIYGDLSFEGRRPLTARSFDRKGLVLLCSSFTKILAPGYRVGWVAPGRYQADVERLKLVSSMGTGTLPQMVIAEFLQRSGYDRYLRRIRGAFQSQVQRMAQAVGKYFPEGTRVTRPSGGFVLWVELPASVDSLQLFERAQEKKISIAPGPIFSPGRQYRNFIRLNCGLAWSARVESALLTLGRLAGDLVSAPPRLRGLS